MSNILQNKSLIALVISLLLWKPFIGFGQTTLKEAAKTAKLTPALFNIQTKGTVQKSSNLRQAAPSDGVLVEDNTSGLTRVDRTIVRDGKIAIEAISNDADGQALLNELQAMGLTGGKYFQRIVFGYFPINKLDQLKNVASLHVARPSYAPLRNAGKVNSQGDKAMRSDVARQTFNVTGAGNKVGVLSDSYNALGGAPDGVASGDLPPNVQVLEEIDDLTNGSDEGRAMAEIVHDVAPGADIAFNSAFNGQVGFALGIINLAKVGCNIIVDDIFYFAEPFFQDGIIAQAVDYVKSRNVTYFSSAGNSARKSYTSQFLNSGRPSPSSRTFTVEGQAHDFGNGAITQKITIPAGGEFFPIFQWSDPFYSTSIEQGSPKGAQTDMDIYVYYQGALQLGLSSFSNNLNDDPIEGVDIVNNSRAPIEIEIAFVKYAGPDPKLIKWIDYGSGATYQFATNSSTTVGHANAAGAIAVGAVRWSQTPEYNPALQAPVIETFSSAGGTPILFTTYGQPIPSVTRLKPEISAADGGNTTFFGQAFPGGDGDNFPNFFGTSAAAPHAAAVAALLQEKTKNSLSPDEVLLRLRTTAIDMDDPLTPGFDTGFDFRTGFGFIQADKALTFGQPLVILQPLYDCQTGKITILTSGGNGSPITFTIPGVIRTSPTSTTGIVEAGLRNDPKNLIITAMQGSVKVVYDFNFDSYCKNQNRARVAANELSSNLQVMVKGNPIATDRVEIEVRGVEGQPLKLQVSNSLGELTGSQSIEMAEAVESHRVSLGRAPGLYFLQVSTPTQTKTVKIIRHQ
ncbi:S8 family peptidase [Spirosoma endophyticum]|uniref:Por secretion system C-terminal sorting domain-containing protein n=1 Tax=Spirosoma endophyticum TaxID=662367 RepID=A0A1I1N3X0_9BACT|nr:S8 family serine peptidase [Spirosoma endophyticum]SFC92319.1 Por secretion system C-terminal sorting domain-containing protein [Spirosoma endophyticum]